ncbi:hypothetical protein D3C71_1239230 [compost metagenome]
MHTWIKRPQASGIRHEPHLHGVALQQPENVFQPRTSTQRKRHPYLLDLAAMSVEIGLKAIQIT